MFRKLLFALAAVCLMTGSAVAADAFPNRPITIVVPFAAGGETDLVARMLADGMSKELKQVVVVQNIVGASGVAGISAVTGAKPDGYTLGVTPSAPLAMHPHMRKVPYTLDSFDFVGRILKAPYIVMVAKTAPWNTLDDMLKDMKANPNTFFFASSGVGSVPYFAMMDLFQEGRGAGPPRPLLRRRRRLPGHRGEPRAGLHLHRRIAGSSMTSRGWPSWTPPEIRCCPTCPR